MEPADEMAASTTGRDIRLAVTGASFTGNQGAAAMLETLVTRAPEHLGRCHFTVLSTFPQQDSRRAKEAVEVIDYSPKQVVATFLAALAYRLLRRIPGSSSAVLRTAAARTFRNSDAVVDISGITFSDKRGVPRHVYHFLLAATPLLLGKPLVKLSQAMGPFRNPLNHLAARITLPRCAALCARGADTVEHLKGLGITDATLAADLAFLHRPDETVAFPASLPPKPARKGTLRIGLAPSAVAASHCSKQGIDYAAIVAEAVNALRERHDIEIVVFAHSAFPGSRNRMMDDLPVCREVSEQIGDRGDTHFLDAPLSATELRHIIESCDVVVTSRFHAMIASLASLVPVAVVGWSHKYEEVLSQFDMQRCAMDYSALNVDGLSEHIERVIDDRLALHRLMEERLPAVQALSNRNFEVLANVLENA